MRDSWDMDFANVTLVSDDGREVGMRVGLDEGQLGHGFLQCNIGQ